MNDLNCLFDAIGISAETATALIARYEQDTLERHALLTLWQMAQGRITNPPGWLIASLRGNFTPPPDFPGELHARTIRFVLDDATYAEVEKCAEQHPDRIMQSRARILINALLKQKESR